jgi:predicted MFS family arabinose efflux permease
MGSSMAIFNMAMSIGMATGPLIGGLVFDSIGLKFSF